MSQNYADECFAGGSDVQTNMQQIENNLAALKSNFSGTSDTAILSKVTGQFWVDTTGSAAILKIRNSSNDAWQNVWDITNNRPMGSVANIGSVTYTTNQLLDIVTISMGSTHTQVATTEFNYVIAGGDPVNKPAVSAGTAFPHAGSAIQVATWGAYAIEINGAGTIDLANHAPGNYDSTYSNPTTGYADAIAAIPATSVGKLRIGTVGIKAQAGGFIEGTTHLDVATTVTYTTTTPQNSYVGSVAPTPSAYSGIYYIQAEWRNYIETPTISFNGLAVKSIKNVDENTLSGPIIDGHWMILYYDSTHDYFVLLNPSVPIRSMAVYNAAGTYTWVRPTGITRVKVTVVGGGGNGGDGQNHPDYPGNPAKYSGGNGGHGGYAEGYIDVSTNVTVVVGSATNTSSFAGDTTISSTGGTTGTTANASIAVNGARGNDGAGSGGMVNLITKTPYTYGAGGKGGYTATDLEIAWHGEGNSAISGTAGGVGLVIIEW